MRAVGVGWLWFLSWVWISNGWALVGGAPVADGGLDSVFIWSPKKTFLSEDSCTATKVGDNLFLTAAHCVLEQPEPASESSPRENWETSSAVEPGKLLRVSFAKDIEEETGSSLVQIYKVHVHPWVQRCLAGGKSPAACNGRTPIPDVALVELSRSSPAFKSAPLSKVGIDPVVTAEAVTTVGYGCEDDDCDRLPRMKSGSFKVAAHADLLAALKGTAADQDGAPAKEFFFASLSPFRDSVRMALGHGDSGGPVFNSAGDVVGINSDGYCPSKKPDCEDGENSTYARLDDALPVRVGRWVQRVIAGAKACLP